MNAKQFLISVILSALYFSPLNAVQNDYVVSQVKKQSIRNQENRVERRYENFSDYSLLEDIEKQLLEGFTTSALWGSESEIEKYFTEIFPMTTVSLQENDASKFLLSFKPERPFELSGSVGNKSRNGQPAKNNPADIRKVKSVFNKLGYQLTVNNTLDEALLRAITDYQKKKVGFFRGDGRIDVPGKTYESLKTAALDEKNVLPGDFVLVESVEGKKTLVLIYTGESAFPDFSQDKFSFFVYPYLTQCEWNTFPPRFHEQAFNRLKKNAKVEGFWQTVQNFFLSAAKSTGSGDKRNTRGNVFTTDKIHYSNWLRTENSNRYAKLFWASNSFNQSSGQSKQNYQVSYRVLRAKPTEKLVEIKKFIVRRIDSSSPVDGNNIIEGFIKSASEKYVYDTGLKGVGNIQLTGGFMEYPGHGKKTTKYFLDKNGNYKKSPNIGPSDSEDEKKLKRKFNIGFDYATSTKDRVVGALLPGLVTDASWSEKTGQRGYGNKIEMKSDAYLTYNGKKYSVYVHYAHLKTNSFKVKNGDRVSQGQAIAVMGGSGYKNGKKSENAYGLHVDCNMWILINGKPLIVSPNLLNSQLPQQSNQTGQISTPPNSQPKQTNRSGPNKRLFDLTTSGAGRKTTKQDGSSYTDYGVKASTRMAGADESRVSKYADYFKQAGKKYGVPPALLAAIASRETRGRNILDGDGGKGVGIMQVDIRSFPKKTQQIKSAVPSEQVKLGIEFGAEILSQNLKAVKAKHPSWSPEWQLRGAVAAYNFGTDDVQTKAGLDKGSTGDDYSADVWERAKYYAESKKFSGVE